MAEYKCLPCLDTLIHCFHSLFLLRRSANYSQCSIDTAEILCHYGMTSAYGHAMSPVL